MSNLITEIYDKQAVVDNLNQLGELINSSLNAIVASAPKLQSPIEYLTAVQSISEIEKKNTEVTQAKAKAMSDLDKAYQQADKAIQQSINLDDAEFQAQTKLTSQYKERAKEQRQLLELERTRQQTMQNGNKLLQMEAKSEAELRMQQQQLIKAQQSLRVTNAEENALREELIAKINANKEALKGMSDEVNKQRDNIGNYNSVLEGNVNVLNLVSSGQLQLKEAMRLVRTELTALEAQQASVNQLTAEQQKMYNDLSLAMGQLSDIQGDISERTKVLADDFRGMTFAFESVKLGVNIMTSLRSVTALLGDENEELQKAMAKVVATRQILNTITQIQNQLNKDGIILTNLRLLAERDLTNATIAQTAATKASIVAMKTLQALQTAGKGIIGVFGAALFGMVKMIKDVVTNTNKAEEAQKAQTESLKEATQATAIQIEKLQEYKQVLDDIAESYNVAIKRADLFTESSAKQVAMGYFMRQFNAELEKYTELSWNYAQAMNQSGVGVREATKAMNEQRDVVQRLAENIRLINAGIGSSDTANSFIWAMGQVENAIKNTNAIAKENNKTTQDATKETDKERQSKEDELSVEEKLYLLRKKINEERKKEEFPALAKVSVKMKEMADMTDILNGRLQSALHIIQYEYTKAVNEATTAEEKSKLAKEQQRKEIELQIEYSKRMLETLPPQTDEWYKLAKAIEDYRKQLGDLNKYEEPEWLKKANERIEATVDMVNEINNYVQTVSDFQLQRLQEQDDAYDAEYERQKEYINNTVLNEAEKNKKLEALDRQKTAHDKAVAKERAEIERRKAIFDASVQAAQAISHAVGSVGELLATSAGGDAYSAVARYIAAIAAGATAVATVIGLVSQMVSIPQYATGGTAEANKPFVAGEKGREIGFGVYSGKMYDFSKPTLFKANEPISIKNAQETKQIINNNTEYNKDVTLKNTIMVKVIDNARVVKYFKL